MIYLDLDDTLADFSGGLLRHGIKNDCAFIHKPKSQWTDQQKELDRQVVEVMKQPGFFMDLPAFKDTRLLWDFCRPFHPFILTAKPSDESSGDRVANEKWIWVTEHLGPINPKQFICCLRSEKKDFIGSSNHKHQILVDDLEANCKEWQSVGGIGVLHTSAKNSIKELQKYV